MASLVVSVERRIGDLAAAAGATEEGKAVEALAELRRIREALEGALGHWSEASAVPPVRGRAPARP